MRDLDAQLPCAGHTLCATGIYKVTNGVSVYYRGISSRDASIYAGWLGRRMLEGDEGIIRVIGNAVILNGAPVEWSWEGHGAVAEAGLARTGLNVGVLRDMARTSSWARSPVSAADGTSTAESG